MCKTEKELLEKTFNAIWSYSVLVTFNGDDFDLPYLYERSQDPEIDPVNHNIIPKEEIPLLVKTRFIRKERNPDRTSSAETRSSYRFI